MTISTPETSSGGADNPLFQPITYTISNCTFKFSGLSASLIAPSLCAIWMNYNVGIGQPNLRVPLTINVTNYQNPNGSTLNGRNFSVYFSQQNPNVYIMPVTTVSGGVTTLLGQDPPGGLNNTQLVAAGKTPYNGSIYPVGSTSHVDFVNGFFK